MRRCVHVMCDLCVICGGLWQRASVGKGAIDLDFPDYFADIDSLQL